MASFVRSQCLILVSGQTLPSADSRRSISSPSTSSSSGRSASSPSQRRERFPRGVPILKSVSAQFRPRTVCRATVDGAAAEEEEAKEEAQEGDGHGLDITNRGDRGQWDVSSNCVKPVFRVTPLVSPESNGLDADKANILFLSEGNVCRSIYAEAMFNTLLKKHGLQDLISCSSKATRDYNVGETADPRAVIVAAEYGLELPEGKVATVFDCSTDIVVSDLVLVMDKFTASDALKEVTVYEIVNKEGRYSGKVRRLGEFCQTQQLEDIEDPLYGNMGGAEETELVRQVYAQIRDSCEGLIDYIMDLTANLEESESLKDGIARGLGRMDALNWLAPPMLSKV